MNPSASCSSTENSAENSPSPRSHARATTTSPLYPSLLFMTATSRPDYRTLVLGALPRNPIRLSLPRPPISGADSAELRLRQAQVADFIQHSEQHANPLDSRSEPHGNVS